MITGRTKKIGRTAAVVGGLGLICFGAGEFIVNKNYGVGSLEVAAGVLIDNYAGPGDHYVRDFNNMLNRGLKVLYHGVVDYVW